MTAARIRRPVSGVVAAVLLAGWASLWAAGGAQAQSMNLGSGDDTPIEIFADNGIEWQQDHRSGQTSCKKGISTRYDKPIEGLGCSSF